MFITDNNTSPLRLRTQTYTLTHIREQHIWCMDYYHCIWLEIHLNVQVNTRKKPTVIVEIRTQMHSHLGSYSEWCCFVSTAQECLFSICFGDYAIKMHWNHLKWCAFSSFPTQSPFDSHIIPMQKLLHCFFSRISQHTFVYAPFTASIKRRTKQTHTHSHINKCIVNLFTHN